MKPKKRISSIALFIWFLFLILFLSAWNADRFVEMMGRDLPGIKPGNAKERTDSWDMQYTKYFRFMEPLAEAAGVSFLALGKQSADNYQYIKDEAGNLQLLEDDFDRVHAEEQMLKLADAFTGRGIPFIFVSLPPRFDKEEFSIGQELDFFGQRDEKMLDVLTKAGVNVVDAGEELRSEGLRYLYPFKTDIHLETEGEIETARLVADKLSTFGVDVWLRDVIFDSRCYWIESRPFAGNLVKSSGKSFAHGSDRFELWFPNFDTDLTVYNPEKRLTKQGAFNASIMNDASTDEERDANPYRYWVLSYLQYPSAYYTIENNRNPDGIRLLIIIDSYAMRMASYLSLGAGYVTVIDPRGENSEEYLEKAIAGAAGEFDAVIVAAGGKDFYDNLRIE